MPESEPTHAVNGDALVGGGVLLERELGGASVMGVFVAYDLKGRKPMQICKRPVSGSVAWMWTRTSLTCPLATLITMSASIQHTPF